MLGFTGYSLALEQLSYWGATVASNITDQVPVVGTIMKRFLWPATFTTSTPCPASTSFTPPSCPSRSSCS